MDRADDDYVPDNEEVDLELVLPKTCDASEDRILLVYESKLKELLMRCLKCGGPVESIVPGKGFGTQMWYTLSCLNGCDVKWSSQPELDAVKGTFSVFVLVVIF